MFSSGDEIMAFVTAIYNKNFAKSRVDREDIISEGVIGVIECESRYNESLGSFSSFAWSSAYWRMLSFCKKQREYSSMCIGGDAVDYLYVKDYGGGVIKFNDTKRALKSVQMNNELQHKIISDMLDIGKQSSVAEINGVSKQYVNVVWNNFCKIVRDRYIVEDGELVERERGV